MEEEFIPTETLIEQCLVQGKTFEKQGKFVQSKLFYEVALRLKELDFIDNIDKKYHTFQLTQDAKHPMLKL